MAFTNSSLATLTRISPNRNSPRNQPITKITIHHMAGVSSIEAFGNLVANPARQMSANYAIGNDGRIGLFCPEQDRSWCSSSPWNDHQAITIEVSNSKYGDQYGWPVSDAAYSSLIKLCVDICKRNGIKKLEFTGDKNGSLTFHYMFNATSCPGPWIKARANEICNKVNAQLTPTTTQPSNTIKPTTQVTIKAGDLVSLSPNATYYTGGNIPGWVKEEKWYVDSVSGDRAVLGLNEAKNRNIKSPINTKYLTVTISVSVAITKTLDAGTPIYREPNGTWVNSIGTTGVYTIVEQKTVNGVVYGKLKSGAGWVILSGGDTIKKGDKVKVLKAVQYGTNKPFKQYVSTYYVLEVNGDRVVISSDGKNTTAAVHKNNLQKI